MLHVAALTALMMSAATTRFMECHPHFAHCIKFQNSQENYKQFLAMQIPLYMLMALHVCWYNLFCVKNLNKSSLFSISAHIEWGSHC
jgi:hypothetical protein